MRNSSGVFAAILVAAVGVALPSAAQRGRGAVTGEKPTVDIVQTVGCAARKAGNPETWMLTRAADARVAPPGIFSTTLVEAAKNAPLGANSFQLIGVADFLDAEGLLKSGQRKEFTTPENANAANQLRDGRKVLVKGMLIDAADGKRINLLAVIALSDSCA